MNHIRFDSESKMEVYFHTVQYSYFGLRVFTELQVVLCLAKELFQLGKCPKHQKPFRRMSVMLCKGGLDDRLDICYVSIFTWSF